MAAAGLGGLGLGGLLAIAGGLLFVIVVVNLAAGFMRYVVFSPFSWSEEAIRYIAVRMTFMGAADSESEPTQVDPNGLIDRGVEIYP